MADTKVEKKVSLNEYIDTFSLSSAEILRFTKIFSRDTTSKTEKEWAKLTGLSKQKSPLPSK